MATRRVALITGASSGIGQAFAEEYAKPFHNKDLILVARSADKLRSLADRLSRLSGGRVEVIVADLALANCGASIAAQVAALGMHVDVLVNNAGFGSIGSFLDIDPQQEQREIALNCAAVVDLCHAFVPQMVARRFGSIINVASVGAFAPMPYMSVYGATKAFVLSFSQALRAEVRPYGLRVVALCPGPVATGFFEASGYTSAGGAFPAIALTGMPTLVRRSLETLRKNGAVVTPGIQSTLLAWAHWLTPTRFLAAAAKRRLKTKEPA